MNRLTFFLALAATAHAAPPDSFFRALHLVETAVAEDRPALAAGLDEVQGAEEGVGRRRERGRGEGEEEEGFHSAPSLGSQPPS